MTAQLTYQEWEVLYERARAACDWDRGYCYHCADGGTCPKMALPPQPPARPAPHPPRTRMPESQPSTIRARASRLLNLLDFEDPGVPERIGSLELEPPGETQYVLRMPICVDGVHLYIPDELAWVCPALAAASWHQHTIRPNRPHPFVYVTVRHGPVLSKTDDEWHVDGFSTRVPHPPEQNYVWCSEVGTEYAAIQTRVPDDFDPLRHNINHLLAEAVDPTLVRSCEERVLYCLDPYLLHRRPQIRTDRPRTFVRISFVPIEIDDVNNTPNPGLPRTCTRDGVGFRNNLSTYCRPG